MLSGARAWGFSFLWFGLSGLSGRFSVSGLRMFLPAASFAAWVLNDPSYVTCAVSGASPRPQLPPPPPTAQSTDVT